MKNSLRVYILKVLNESIKATKNCKYDEFTLVFPLLLHFVFPPVNLMKQTSTDLLVVANESLVRQVIA